MLFDLRGKRKRVVQVSYAALAAIFLVGFVGFSIGSGNSPGGIFDALGLGNGSSSSGSTAYDSQIANAQGKLKKNPQDEAALLTLTRYQYLAGQQSLGAPPSPTSPPVVTDAALADFGKASNSWNRYLKVTAKPDPGVAAYMAQGYAYLNDATGAAKAEQIVAKARPSANTYGTLALYLYAGGDLAGGDAAAKKAVAESPKSTRKQTQQQLASIRKRAVQLKKQAAKSSGGKSAAQQALQNPVGGLAPSATTPTAP